MNAAIDQVDDDLSEPYVAEPPARRHGMTVPLPGSLAGQRDRITELADLGYTDVWSSETDGADAFTPLVLAAAWEPRLRVGTAVIPAYTRAPACLAQSVASLAAVASGRLAVGIGASSDVLVERWNDMTFENPVEKVRDVMWFLRDVFDGQKVTKRYSTFDVRGFQLGVPVRRQPPVLVGALREKMLRLAGREADGVILTLLSADDVRRVTEIALDAADGAPREVVARIFVCPSDDAALARAAAKRFIARQVTVSVYAAFHNWLGRGEQLRTTWDVWSTGSRELAAASVPDEVADELVVHGTPAECRAHIERYAANGVTTTVLAPVPLPAEEAGAAWDLVRELAPARA